VPHVMKDVLHAVVNLLRIVQHVHLNIISIVAFVIIAAKLVDTKMVNFVLLVIYHVVIAMPELALIV